MFLLRQCAAIHLSTLSEFWGPPLYYAENGTPENVKVYSCAVEQDGVKFSWLLELPSLDEAALTKHGLRSVQGFGKVGLFVDGIYIENNKLNFSEGNLGWLCHSGQLNFTGEIRPVLSVDRTSITSWPEVIKNMSKDLLQQVVLETIEVAKNHIENECLTDSSQIALAVWDYLLSNFHTCRANLLHELAQNARYASVILSDISELTKNNTLTLQEFLDTSSICLPRLGYYGLGLTAKLLFLAKCGNAERLVINDSGLEVTGSGFSPIVKKRSSIRDFGYTEILLRCDDWSGKLSEFDLVTDFWPVIPLRLFDRLISNHLSESIVLSKRAMELNRLSNGISALVEQDACLVHPLFGLYHEDDHSMFSRGRAKKTWSGDLTRLQIITGCLN